MTIRNAGESLVQTWATSQQKLITEWLATVRRFGGTPSLELWKDTVDAWQSSVKETLDAQAQWATQFTETLATATGTPDELRALARQGQDDLRRWAEAERDLWQGWFNIVRSLNFRPEPEAVRQTGQNLVQIWQDTAHQMIDTQATLVQSWLGGRSATK
ncbi:MAG TPA: hypothetical protein VKY74_05295 [Chloroflexia bacterium]|nr:hypothetical protein [Chloroflexia bacterium]